MDSKLKAKARLEFKIRTGSALFAGLGLLLLGVVSPYVPGLFLTIIAIVAMVGIMVWYGIFTGQQLYISDLLYFAELGAEKVGDTLNLPTGRVLQMPGDQLRKLADEVLSGEAKSLLLVEEKLKQIRRDNEVPLKDLAEKIEEHETQRAEFRSAHLNLKNFGLADEGPNRYFAIAQADLNLPVDPADLVF